mgnify:FL=1
MISDLTIIDASSVLAGPSVGTFFAEMGAKVIKVEGPKGDVTQNWRTPGESALGWSAYYSSVNFGKTITTLDLKTRQGQKDLLGLLKTADVFITNFKSSDYSSLGLDAETIFSLNPQLVWGKIKGFEENQKRLAFDVVLQAETGFMSMNGQPQSPPTKMPVALIDVLAAHQLKEGLLCGLLHREKTQKGGVVEVSLEAAALSSLANQASNYLMNGVVAKPMGSQHPNIAPYGDLFVTSDGVEVVLAIGSDSQFNALCRTLGLEVIPEWNHNVDRVKNRESLAAALSEKINQWPSGELLKKALDLKIPLGAVNNLKQVFDKTVAQAMVRTEWQDQQETKRVTQVAFDFVPYSKD